MNKNQLLIIIILVVVFIISLLAFSIMPAIIVPGEMEWTGGVRKRDILNVIIFQFLFNIVLVIFLVILLSIILYLLRESERTSKSVNIQ